jgi:hypothetical protein
LEGVRKPEVKFEVEVVGDAVGATFSNGLAMRGSQ